MHAPRRGPHHLQMCTTGFGAVGFEGLLPRELGPHDLQNFAAAIREIGADDVLLSPGVKMSWGGQQPWFK